MIKLWNCGTYRRINVFTPFMTTASKCFDISVKIFPRFINIMLHFSVVTSVGFLPDGNSLASGSADRSIKLWDLRSRQLIQHYPAHADDVTSISVHPVWYARKLCLSLLMDVGCLTDYVEWLVPAVVVARLHWENLGLARGQAAIHYARPHWSHQHQQVLQRRGFFRLRWRWPARDDLAVQSGRWAVSRRKLIHSKFYFWEYATHCKGSSCKGIL